MVLKAIYEQGIKLPDSAQELIPEAQCKPDFIYKKARIAIFCDGSVHDSPEQQKRDRIQRENISSVLEKKRSFISNNDAMTKEQYMKKY